ncbi:MAG: ureidoglycolate lyase [Ferrovibrio sp.]|uniref:ureidoglycolate lyase n=1 Tax=Ferrovibrio sp. TaxID=1917215 RepID=UPI00262524A9|nr:ureidoglycolate lyase [Ferrovibrio sp.]MCW0234502.1 ureidoglycolate lyase [Ferrovibrio sp.]
MMANSRNMPAPPVTPLPVEVLTAEAFTLFGWMLGKPFPGKGDAAAYASAGSDFWHEHAFNPGAGGEHEILWVKYRVSTPSIDRLETHHLTEQAVIPLVGNIIQIVAVSDGSGAPDLATLRAFSIFPGSGICMRPSVWHATRTGGQEATCMMLTRGSTTADLVSHLTRGVPATESRLLDINRFQLDR